MARITINGTETGELLFGSFGSDDIDGRGGSDLIFGLSGADHVLGGGGDDIVFGGFGADTVEGGAGADILSGGNDDDVVIGNTGDDVMSGGAGDDLLVWNNGDGSDLMLGGSGRDRVQVNFDTDLVDDDLQNADVAEFSVTEYGIQFARIELNGQTERGLFQLDIRGTEAQEVDFGGGADTAKLVGTVLDEIELYLDGGDGVDHLDLSRAAAGVTVKLRVGELGESTAIGFENVTGSVHDDTIRGDREDNVLSGLDGEDLLAGQKGDDTIAGNRGDDRMFGGAGDDKLVWNNGDGSDFMHGGTGDDRVQVNFDTDLVDDDLQNADVAEYSVSDAGVRFARVELNGQTERGLFQLDIRKTETLETNFGGGDDTARIVDDVLDRIALDLDGGDGVDVLDLGSAAAGVEVDLDAGTLGASSAVNFENVIGSAHDDTISGDAGDNVIRGGSGSDELTGGAGADTFVFLQGDEGVDVITDFDIGVDRLLFESAGPSFARSVASYGAEQVGDDVELQVGDRTILIENLTVADLGAGDLAFA